MKNLECKLFYIDTPLGADYITCPLCGKWIDYEETIYFNLNKETKSYGLIFSTCCNILFDISHEYISRGCTDSTYYSIKISKYKYKTENINNIILFLHSTLDYKNCIDDWIYISEIIYNYIPKYIYTIYKGFPQFSSKQDCINKILNKEVIFLELECNCNKDCKIDLLNFDCILDED